VGIIQEQEVEPESEAFMGKTALTGEEKSRGPQKKDRSPFLQKEKNIAR